MRQCTPCASGRGESDRTTRSRRDKLALAVLGMAAASTPAAASSWIDHTIAQVQQQPGALLQGKDGNFYGVSALGGQYNCGTVFQIVPPATAGGSYTANTLHSFNYAVDGCQPNGLIQGSDGNLYGATDLAANDSNDGTVFELVAPFGPGFGFRTWFTFDPTQHPGSPSSMLQGTDGNFYGVTATNRYTNIPGSVFELSPSATPGAAPTYRLLYRYNGTTGDLNNGGPRNLFRAKDGSLYGTVFIPYMNQSAAAAIFQLAPPATPGGSYTFYTIYNAPSSSDQNNLNLPMPALQGKDGAIYGLYFTEYLPLPSTYQGTVFRFTPPATPGAAVSLQTLHTFAGDAQGGAPTALIQGNDGNFYGTAMAGTYRDGIAFQLTPPASAGGNFGFNKLRDFFGETLTSGPDDGIWPGTLVQGSDGKLYGTTAETTYSVNGIVFQIEASSSTPQAPVWVAPTPADNTHYTITATLPFSLPLEASVAQAGDQLRIGDVAMYLPDTAYLSTGADGNPSSATLQWTPVQAGSYNISLYAGDIQTSLAAPQRNYSFTVLKRSTGLTAHAVVVDTQAVDLLGLPLTLSVSATLDALNPSQPLASFLIQFSTSQGPLCQALTNSNGVATCSGQVMPTTQELLTAIENDGFTATYAGNESYSASSGSAKLVSILGKNL